MSCFLYLYLSELPRDFNYIINQNICLYHSMCHISVALKHEFLHHTSVSSRKQFLHHKAGYRHIHAIKVDKRIFRRYRKLGVRLVGKGILVNGYCK